MKLRFLSPDIHGIVDYVAAIVLIIAPFLLRLGNSNPLAFWLSIATGIVVVMVSLTTRYRFGVFKMIPFDGHLALDLLVATVFMLVPFLFELDGLDEAYYYINAVVVYLVVAVTKNEGRSVVDKASLFSCQTIENHILNSPAVPGPVMWGYIFTIQLKLKKYRWKQ